MSQDISEKLYQQLKTDFPYSIICRYKPDNNDDIIYVVSIYSCNNVFQNTFYFADKCYFFYDEHSERREYTDPEEFCYAVYKSARDNLYDSLIQKLY